MTAAYAEKALADVMPFVGLGAVPEEARFVRKIGCPKTRQFEVLELGYSLIVREVPTAENPMPGPYSGVLPMAQLLKALATDVLKANDQAVAEKSAAAANG
jgi:hypothetical protein